MGIYLLVLALATDFRGVWIPRWSIPDSTDIFVHLEGKFNHIFLQIFALGQAYYPSKYAPSEVQSDRWLKEFLDEAHRRQIKVSAWINVFYAWGFAPRTDDREHPINREPQWYVQDRFERSILAYDISELRNLGIEGYYLAPSNIQVRAYLTRIIEEIISQYDFDGVHLDYIRYPSKQFIYDISLRSKFMRRYYVDPLGLFRTSELKTRYSLWGYDDLRRRWQEYISTDLTQFIKDLNENLKRLRPGIELSVAVKPNLLTAQNDYYQDWVDWLNSGYVDFACLMAYTRNIERYLRETQLAIREPHRVTFGLALYLLSPNEIGRQVELISSTPYAGVVFFSYKQIKENKRYLYTLP